MEMSAKQAAAGGLGGSRGRTAALLSALAVAALLGAAGAGPAAAKSKPACPDGGPTLPITGLCAGRAVAYLNVVEGGETEAPDGCSWVVQETEWAAGDVLLYRALQCGKTTAKLSFESGAQQAELRYEASPMGWPKGTKIVSVFSADPADPTANVLAIARAAMENPKEAAKCSVRPAGYDFWPADALVVDVSAKEAAKAPKDEPRTACGPYGLDEDSATYWRVFQGFSWFFELGQDMQEFDTRSFTLMTKDANGDWTQAQ